MKFCCLKTFFLEKRFELNEKKTESVVKVLKLNFDTSTDRVRANRMRADRMRAGRMKADRMRAGRMKADRMKAGRMKAN